MLCTRENICVSQFYDLLFFLVISDQVILRLSQILLFFFPSLWKLASGLESPHSYVGLAKRLIQI